MKPALTVAIAALNAAAYIREAIMSVRQGARDVPVEIVLADGGSCDDTLAIARAAADESSLPLSVVPGPDSGIYDGMNRAIAHAGGEHILILNSDDRLTEGALPVLLARMTEQSQDLVSGSAAIYGSAGKIRIVESHAQAMTPRSILFGVPIINARLFRAAMLRRVGPFDKRIGLAADRELLLRVGRATLRRASVPNVVYEYRAHAGSHTIAGDVAARHRIATADAALAHQLLADPLSDPVVRSEVVSFQGALGVKAAAIKLRSIGWAPLPDISTSPVAIARGLIHTLTWRGRGSGW